MQDSTLFMILISVQSIITLLIVIGFAYFMVKQSHYRMNLEKKVEEEITKRLAARVEKIEKTEIVEQTKILSKNTPPIGTCVNHTEKRAVATCAICDILICEDCVSSDETLHFCHEHFQVYLSNEWKAIASEVTTPDNTAKSDYLIQFKKNQWEQFKSPLYIQVHYQINVDTDEIESNVSLFAPKSNEEEMALKLNKGS